MKSFEYKNGEYIATCGAMIYSFFSEVLSDLALRGQDEATAIFNGTMITIFPDSRLEDILDKYGYKRVYLQLKNKYE